MDEEYDVEQEPELAVSEQDHDEQEEAQTEQKMVPLSAMLATRKKLQEAEARANKAEADSQAYQQYMMRANESAKEPAPNEDLDALIERKHLNESTALTKREILETIYQDMNPEAVQQINLYLKLILDKKPWLAQSVDSAQNRYSRAHEIVKDYMHLVDGTASTKASETDGQRIIRNAQKPRSPAEAGKSAQPEGVEYLKSIQGKKEFREYRDKVRRGES